MTNPNDIPQDVWDKASRAYEVMPEISGDWDIVGWLAALIYAAKEEEREDIWAIASGNAEGRRELERLAMEAGDAEGCLLYALLARENDQIADAILDRKLANNTNKD